MKDVIGVIGGSQANPDVCELAAGIGEQIARNGCALVCGGLGGIMEAASQGAKKYNGTVLGILPSSQKEDANPYVDFAIPTAMGYGRNILVVNTADVLIALPGSYGTLSEMGFALNMRKPIIALPGSWKLMNAGEIEPRLLTPAQNAKDAVLLACEKLSRTQGE